MRQSSFDRRWSATLCIIVANVIAFLLQMFASLLFAKFPIYDYLALSVEGLRHGYIWQLVSFQFMHGGWLHLIFNCLAIYMFGGQVEEALGRKSFLTLYFLSGIVGGLVQILAGVLFRGAFAASVVGASAGAFGLVAAFARLYPEESITNLLFFVIPITMRAKYLLVFLGVIAVVGVLIPAGNIAHAAHLGGMITGIVFVRFVVHWPWQWPAMPRTPAGPRKTVRMAARKAASWGKRGDDVDEDLPAAEFLSREVDPILDKISAHGIQSLTERERRVLQAAREKMARR
jgi:membrane associated rhomboid family serine protease